MGVVIPQRDVGIIDMLEKYGLNVQTLDAALSMILMKGSMAKMVNVLTAALVFENLTKTAGIEQDKELFIKIRHIDKANFLTKGKLLDLHALCHDKDIDLVIFSDILTSLQERNLHPFCATRGNKY